MAVAQIHNSEELKFIDHILAYISIIFVMLTYMHSYTTLPATLWSSVAISTAAALSSSILKQAAVISMRFVNGARGIDYMTKGTSKPVHLRVSHRYLRLR